MTRTIIAALCFSLVGSLATAKDNPLAKYAQRVAVDEFNTRTQAFTPKRDGVLRIRSSADPTNLNPLVHRDASAASILKYLSNSLISRDPETFEYYPVLARNWEMRDLVILKDGKRLEGRVIEESDTAIRIDEGAGALTLGRWDVASVDVGNGVVIEKSGKRHTGVVTEYEYTVEIERTVSQEPRRIPLSDIGETTASIGATAKSRKAINRRCVFYMPLREGVRWHDGAELTPEDYIFGYKTLMNPAVDAARIRSYYLDIESVEVVEKRTIKFTYRKPYFMALDICGSLDPLPRHIHKPGDYADEPDQDKTFAKDFNATGAPGDPVVGLGPYRLKSWKRGESIVIERNADYWASKLDVPFWKPEQPYIDSIQWVIKENPIAALKALQNGEVDVDFDVEPTTWTREDTNTEAFTDKIVRARGVVPLYTYIGWNQRKPYFADAQVREAMTHLIPREQILKDIHKGLGRVVTGPFFIDGPAYDASLPLRPYDPKKAKSLLRRARWLDRDGDGILDQDGVPLEFEYMIHNAREYHSLIADIVKEHVEQAGIRVTIRKLDWTVFINSMNERNFDAARGAWGAGFDPDPFQIWHSSQAENRGSNSVGFNNPRVDELIEQGREEFDANKRWEMMREVHRIVYAEQPFTFLFCFDNLFFYNADLRGVKCYKVGDGYDLTEWYFAE